MNAMKYLLILLALSGAACETIGSETGPDGDYDAAALRFLYEEEKVARDVYDYFEALYGLRPFVNISNSEQSHFDRMENLLLDLGVMDLSGVIRTEPGEFENADLQALYAELTERGEASETEALRVGAFIEERDLTDLHQMASSTENSLIRDTMEYLIAASENHLRAFVRNLTNRGIAYEPVLLSPEDFNAIINGN